MANIYDIRRYGRLLFFAVAAVVALIFLSVSNRLVKDLAAQERERMELWADATKEIISQLDAEFASPAESVSDSVAASGYVPATNVDFLLKIINGNTTIPVLLTDDAGNIILHRNFDLPEPIDTLSPWVTSPANEAFLQRKLERLQKGDNQIRIPLSDGTAQMLYFADSKLLYRLSYYPYVQLFVMLVFVMIVYFAVNSTRRAEQKDRDRELYATVWQGDNHRFFLTRSSRDLHRIDICSYTLGQDSIVPVIEERMNTYQETRPLFTFGNGKELVHWSERDGWAHLYLYNDKGELKNRITKGPWHVDGIVKVDEATRTIYFVANGREKGEHPYHEHLYRVNADGSGLRQLTAGDYFHEVAVDDNCHYFVDNFSRVNTVPCADLMTADGRKVMTLQESDFSQLRAAGYQFPEIFTVKAADGVTDLYGVMYKPYNFDSTKVYPIVDYVYPGPQVEAVYYPFTRMSPRTDRLAQAGFIVISVGQRGGHPSRSKWYHNYGYGNMRDYPLADHKAAVEQLAARHPFIDIDRVGIHGHSGGGFMSTAAICQYPDFYKAAVSCAGNHDNRIYNRWWSETHHGVKEEVTEKGDTIFSYKIATNPEIVKNLKGHLLLIHGDIDNNVHPANSIRVVNALIKAGKRFDMLLLPGQRHGFGDMNEYFYWRLVDYFSEHLKGRKESSVDIPKR